jgi:hypothetical protein
VIIALAGRRVDPDDAKELRFSPAPESLAVVRRRIRSALQTLGVIALVSSAACGADLIALLEAANLGLRRRVILPFSREKFRATSVTDRPGEWGVLYDRLLDEIQRNRDLLIVQPSSEEKAYLEVNHRIVDEALSLGLELKEPVTALLVWDGRSRGDGDLTEEFGAYARAKEIPIVEVSTLPFSPSAVPFS